MSMTWWNWLRMPPASLMWLGPGHAHALPRAAEVRGDLLGPLERRVERPGPADRHVVVGLVRAPDVVEVLQLVVDRDFDAVEHGDLVGRADRRAFGAGAVVAADVDDERVVELAHVLDGLDHAADLVVGVGQVGGVNFDLADEQLLLVGRELVPFLQQVVRPGGQLRVLRDHAELLLVGEDRVAQFVPALVEQVHVPESSRSIPGSGGAARACRRGRSSRRTACSGSISLSCFIQSMASSAIAVVRFQPGLPT